jgi:hypothetical protein
LPVSFFDWPADFFSGGELCHPRRGGQVQAVSLRPCVTANFADQARAGSLFSGEHCAALHNHHLSVPPWTAITIVAAGGMVSSDRERW